MPPQPNHHPQASMVKAMGNPHPIPHRGLGSTAARHSPPPAKRAGEVGGGVGSRYRTLFSPERTRAAIVALRRHNRPLRIQAASTAGWAPRGLTAAAGPYRAGRRGPRARAPPGRSLVDRLRQVGRSGPFG
jgi:hypothetical protein